MECKMLLGCLCFDSNRLRHRANHSWRSAVVMRRKYGNARSIVGRGGKIICSTCVILTFTWNSNVLRRLDRMNWDEGHVNKRCWRVSTCSGAGAGRGRGGGGGEGRVQGEEGVRV